MKKANITQIGKTTYRFTETAFGADVYMYLLVGGTHALLIDTGYGFTDIPAAIREITSLPLAVVNTHGHMDHIHGNHLYPFVYLPAKDVECFRRHTNREYLMSLLADILKENRLPAFLIRLPGLYGAAAKVAASHPSVHKPLPEVGYFELGGRRVTVLHTPGHTLGSISLLDEKSGWLFSGDTTCRDGVLLHFPESTDVATFRDSIQMLKSLADTGKITRLFPGHQETPLGTDILNTYLEACDVLLDGKAGEQVLRSGRLTYKGLTIAFDRIKTGGMMK